MRNSEHLVIRPGLTITKYVEKGAGWERTRLLLAGVDDQGRPFSVDFYGKSSNQPGSYGTPLDDLIIMLGPEFRESGEKPHE